MMAQNFYNSQAFVATENDFMNFSFPGAATTAATPTTTVAGRFPNNPPVLPPFLRNNRPTGGNNNSFLSTLRSRINSNGNIRNVGSATNAFRNNSNNNNNPSVNRFLTTSNSATRSTTHASTTTTRTTSQQQRQNNDAKVEFRQMSLDMAMAPLNRTAVAPFAKKNEKKRALVSASYYSECSMNNIAPTEADSAALDAQSLYEKWWIRTKKEKVKTDAVAAAALALKEKSPTDIVTSAAAAVVGDEDNCSSKKRKLIHSSYQPLPQQPQSAQKKDWQSILNRSSSFLRSESKKKLTAESSSSSPPSSTTTNTATTHNSTFNIRDTTNNESITPYPNFPLSTTDTGAFSEILTAKKALKDDLKRTGGDVTSPTFRACLSVMQSYYASKGWDARWSGKSTVSSPSSSAAYSVDGTWLALSKPTYTECLGTNEKGEYLYTMGRMSFDMFRPTQLRCSIQGVYNMLRPSGSAMKKARSMNFPKAMQDMQLLQQSLSSSSAATTASSKAKSKSHDMYNYDIAVAFTIEANQTRKGEPATPGSDEFVLDRPIHGLLTNQGYCVPDPDTPNRLSVWFSGGELKVKNEDNHDDLSRWKLLLDESQVPHRSVAEFARVVAAKFLLGATIHEMNDEDGTFNYDLKRPIGGHGQVFCDVLYCDNDMRIQQGHQGSIFVAERVDSI